MHVIVVDNRGTPFEMEWMWLVTVFLFWNNFVECDAYLPRKTLCPCEDEALCQPIHSSDREEIFIFSLTKDPSVWQKYNWTKITTVVMFGNVIHELMCLAHKNGARAVVAASFPVGNLTNAESRSKWVDTYLAEVKNNYLDGINIDFEDAIPRTQVSVRDGYTALISETYQKFKLANKNYQVTVDVAWSPDCIDDRCYDYASLAHSTDFLFVMSYDEQSQIRGDCVAKANSGLYQTLMGLKQYQSLGISPHKLVLGVPWYGYEYRCLSLSKDNTCAIKHVPFRGVNCSDAAGRQIAYYTVVEMLKGSTSGRIWDKSSLSPYFNYADKGVMYQIRYDDPESLSKKYDMAIKMKLRGVGMWNADSLDYSSDTPETIKQRNLMWKTLPEYNKNYNFNERLFQI